jgi:hypothetical protein
MMHGKTRKERKETQALAQFGQGGKNSIRPLKKGKNIIHSAK